MADERSSIGSVHIQIAPMGPKGNVKISMDGKAAYPHTFLYLYCPKNYTKTAKLELLPAVSKIKDHLH